MRIKDYPETDTLSPDDVFVIDGEKGTGCIKAGALGVVATDPAISHRNAFRGKNLGSELTEGQKESIRNGTFDDLYVGDYWVIDDITWRIADINYWIGAGDTPIDDGCTTPHLVIIPDEYIGSPVQMNHEKTNNGGYTGSEMYTTHLEDVKQRVFSIFGQEHILNHREVLVNGSLNGNGSSRIWEDSTVEIPCQTMLFGYDMIPLSVDSIAETTDGAQLALFRLDSSFINKNRYNYWLRDLTPPRYFGISAFYKGAVWSEANAQNYIRPVFGLTG